MSSSREEATRTFTYPHAAKAGSINSGARDGGSAAAAGFPTFATTRAGIAYALAKQDYRVTFRIFSVRS